MLVLEDRTHKILSIAIRNHVLQGSIIYTDSWKGYNGLNRYGFRQMTVNHSESFVHPETGVNTNTIEGL